MGGQFPQAGFLNSCSLHVCDFSVLLRVRLLKISLAVVAGRECLWRFRGIGDFGCGVVVSVLVRFALAVFDELTCHFCGRN